MPKSFVEKPICVSLNFRLTKRFRMKWKRPSRFSVKIVVSHSTQKFLGGPSAFHELFGIEKYDGQKRGRKKRFSLESFCLTVPNCFVDESLCVSKS